MGKTLPMLPELSEFKEDALMYVLENSGAPDRDRKITMQKLREFFTTENNEFREVTLAPASPGAVTTVDVTGTKNVTIVVWGRFPNPTDNRIDIVGTIPEGCAVTVLSVNLGLLDLRVQGSAPTTSPEELDFGFLGRAELVSRDGAFLLTVMNDSRWNKMRLTKAVEAETTRAQTVEGNLAGMIQGEATQRQDDITQTQALISAEVDRATAAEYELTRQATQALIQRRVSPVVVSATAASLAEASSSARPSVRGPANPTLVPLADGSAVEVIHPHFSWLVGKGEQDAVFAETLQRKVLSGSTGLQTVLSQVSAEAAQELVAIPTGNMAINVTTLSWTEALQRVLIGALGMPTPRYIYLDFLLPNLPSGTEDKEMIVEVKCASDVEFDIAVANWDQTAIRRFATAQGFTLRHFCIRARWYKVWGHWVIDAWWMPSEENFV